MKQIPNIEETHNTRESAKKVLKEYYGYKSEQDVPDGLAAVLEDWLHHQLQKARHDWLREEIVKLEGMKVCTDAGRADPNYYHCENTRDGTLQTIIDRYQKELDQDKALQDNK